MKIFKLWQLGLLLIVLANSVYFTKNFIGWVITLGFFLLVPGYLLLRLITEEIKSSWEALSFSLGLSVLIMMLGGLALNSIHAFGLQRPLTTLNIFFVLDIITLILLILNKRLTFTLSRQLPQPGKGQISMFLALTMLPLLAIGGAIRLNNGASNILTMILFLLIAVIFVILVLRNNLQQLYPYAIIMIGLSVLFTISLRSWFISGGDAQAEFYTFQLTSKASYWSIAAFRNPYNACLSITILPTIIAKITYISASYVYKIVFQIIFAVGLLPIYLLIKRLRSASAALIGSFIFISFPTFLNGLSSLDRQEVAFIFFGLLLLASFLNVPRKPRKVLVILVLLGLILSHYSSSYITLGLLILSWIFYRLLTWKRLHLSTQQFMPLLSLPIILIALLITFLWNSQITTTTAGLKQTVTKSIESLLDHSSEQSQSVDYSILAPTTKPPQELLVNAAGDNADNVQYIPQQDLPVTNLGKTVSHFVSAGTLNSLMRAFSARILQALVIVGLSIALLRRKKNDLRNNYFLALSCSCVVLLLLQTLLPQLSVDYGTLRFFQQALIVLNVSIILGAEFLLSFFSKRKNLIVAIFFAFLFLDLSGFVPQMLGGYPPQLALDNSGLDYQDYYVHRSDLVTGAWISSNVHGQSIAMGPLSQTALEQYILSKKITTTPLFSASKRGYVYENYANAVTGRYDIFLEGDHVPYILDGDINNSKSLIYTVGTGQVYR